MRALLLVALVWPFLSPVASAQCEGGRVAMDPTSLGLFSPTTPRASAFTVMGGTLGLGFSLTHGSR